MIHTSRLAPRIESFRPVGNKLLLRRHPREKKSGSIPLPSIASHSEMAEFTVLQVGPKVEKADVKPGDVVLAPCQLQFTKVELGEGQQAEPLEIAPWDLLAAVIPA